MPCTKGVYAAPSMELLDIKIDQTMVVAGTTITIDEGFEDGGEF